jgi:hypothetical protein
VGNFISIHQVDQKDCGPAVLKMLLSYVHDQALSIFIDETWPRPMTFKQLVLTAESYGVTLKGYKLHHFSSIRGINRPFIGLFHQPHGHYKLVIPKKRHCYQIIDPIGIKETVKVDFFKHQFSGYLLLVKHVRPLATAITNLPKPFFKGFFLLSASLIWSQMIMLITINQPWLWMIGPMTFISFTATWIYYIFIQTKKLDQWMVKTYRHHLTNRSQFERFHQWKQGIIVLPLQQFYRLILLGTLWGYLTIAAPWVLLPSLLHHSSLLLWKQHYEKNRRRMVENLQQSETQLTYPITQDQPLQKVYRQVYQLTRLYLLDLIVNVTVALTIMIMTSMFRPMEHLLTLISAISSCLVSFHFSYASLNHQREKQQWRQQGYHFLNHRIYANIKT